MLFFLLCRFPRDTPINEIILRRYGQPLLAQFRRTEKTHFKIKKLEDDLRFLHTCKEYGIIPKFIKFIVYNANFYCTKLYRSWLFKLLDIEISNQCKKLKKLKDDFGNLYIFFMYF